MARAAAQTVVEDWTHAPPGAQGIPAGWQGESWGKVSAYDLAIVDDDGHRALRMRSAGDRVTISLDLHGGVELSRTPILEWTWKVTVLPRGGDARVKGTADLGAQVYVVWPRFPALLRSRIIGYAWDTTAPAGSIFRSRKAPTVTYVILRSGAADLGRWMAERRDVAADYRRIYGEDPEPPRALTLSTDSNDTRSSSEALVGPLRFLGR